MCRWKGKVEGLITEVQDELHAQSEAWSKQLRHIPGTQLQGTKTESLEWSFRLHIVDNQVASQVPLEVGPQRRRAANLSAGQGPPNLCRGARGQAGQPPALRPAAAGQGLALVVAGQAGAPAPVPVPPQGPVQQPVATQ